MVSTLVALCFVARRHAQFATSSIDVKPGSRIVFMTVGFRVGTVRFGLGDHRTVDRRVKGSMDHPSIDVFREHARPGERAVSFNGVDENFESSDSVCPGVGVGGCAYRPADRLASSGIGLVMGEAPRFGPARAPTKRAPLVGSVAVPKRSVAHAYILFRGPSSGVPVALTFGKRSIEGRGVSTGSALVETKRGSGPSRLLVTGRVGKRLIDVKAFPMGPDCFLVVGLASGKAVAVAAIRLEGVEPWRVRADGACL